MEYVDNKDSVRHQSFKVLELPEGVKVGVFQGSRGGRPDLDIIVKYQELGKRVRTPQHVHWAIDVLIKKEHNRELTLEFVNFLREMYSKVKPFTTKAEQQACNLTVSNPESLVRFSPLNEYGEYNVEFISTILELIMIQEKTGNAAAFMFKDLLDAIYDEKDIFYIVSKAGYKGR